MKPFFSALVILLLFLFCKSVERFPDAKTRFPLKNKGILVAAQDRVSALPPVEAAYRVAAGEDGGRAYYAAMEQVIGELHRVLRNRRYMALYVSDSWRKKKGGPKGSGAGTFMPIGFELFALMRRHFIPVDIICVVRQNQKLDRGNWRKAAVEENFFLRGFNYLFIMKKVDEQLQPQRARK